MKRLTLFAALAVTLCGPALAQETRIITDDTGTEVTIPADPQRIVSLHDSVLTVPLLELGANVVGSMGRGESTERAHIRGSLSITGIDFDNSEIAWLGGNPSDVERIAATRPDLILTTQWQQTHVDQLRAIAPTVVLDYTLQNEWEIYDLLAELTGTTERLERFKRRYDDQIATIRQVIDTEEVTVSTLHVNNGQMFAINPYGNIGKVLVDAGFTQPQIIEEIPAGARAEFTAESLPEFDGDFLITTYRGDTGQTPDDIRAEFDSVLSGWCNQLHACLEDQMLLVDRTLGSTRSYYALGAVSYMILSEIGGREFTPISE